MNIPFFVFHYDAYIYIYYVSFYNNLFFLFLYLSVTSYSPVSTLEWETMFYFQSPMSSSVSKAQWLEDG